MVANGNLLRRLAAFVAIAMVAFALGTLPRVAMPGAVQSGDDFFYDVFYRARPIASQKDTEVIIVSADDPSLAFIAQNMERGWPWPRQVWGKIVTYLDKAGAKVIAFDLLFAEPSMYRSEGDDDAFLEDLKAARTPIVFGNYADPGGEFRAFAPKLENPRFGAVNINREKICRRYNPVVEGRDSLAVAAVKAAGLTPAIPAKGEFLLHYYGPHATKRGETTYHFLPAGVLFDIAMHPEKAAEYKISESLFKDKIVLIGTSAVGTFDLKSSPLDAIFPGVEVQATAVSNLIHGHAVVPVARMWQVIVALCAALAVAAGVIFPRSAAIKSLVPVLAVGGIFAAGVLMFRGEPIRWLTPTDALLTVAFATPLAFAWTYFAEDRQRRFMLKALSKVVSPAVAEELARDPGRLQLGTVRTELTLIFTDLANFTDLAEKMDVQTLGTMINKYLGAMSDEVFAQHGTLDKYIGDAVMCFFNAPLLQADHAARACRTALAMVQRETQIAGELEAMSSGKKIYTRIGINSTSAAVGFVGSSHLYNYTALGDGVNLASRLEGANKVYSTRIMVSESTVSQVRDAFVFRKIDVLRVKGKREPMAVFELIAETGGPGDTPERREKAALYESALAAYQRQDWDEAERLLLELSKRFGQDGPATTLGQRIAIYRESPPAREWDGVYVAKEK